MVSEVRSRILQFENDPDKCSRKTAGHKLLNALRLQCICSLQYLLHCDLGVGAQCQKILGKFKLLKSFSPYLCLRVFSHVALRYLFQKLYISTLATCRIIFYCRFPYLWYGTQWYLVHNLP